MIPDAFDYSGEVYITPAAGFVLGWAEYFKHIDSTVQLHKHRPVHRAVLNLGRKIVHWFNFCDLRAAFSLLQDRNVENWGEGVCSPDGTTSLRYMHTLPNDQGSLEFFAQENGEKFYISIVARTTKKEAMLDLEWANHGDGLAYKGFYNLQQLLEYPVLTIVLKDADINLARWLMRHVEGTGQGDYHSMMELFQKEPPLP